MYVRVLSRLFWQQGLAYYVVYATTIIMLSKTKGILLRI